MKLKLLFAAALILLLSTVRAQCPTPTIPSGTGTLSDPYQIATFSNLRWLSETPAVWGAGTYFIQTANIDASCTSDPSYNTGAGFSPIGLATTQFQGNYDGQGYFISNIFINRSVCYVGVFGYANNAQITNLNIQNCNISSTCRVGGLIGQGMNVTVSNCQVNGNVSCGSSGYVGGLAAIISIGNITNCSANVQVSTTQNCAGCLIGWANACTITNCWSGGSASASDMVGGFIGQLSSSLSLVSSCYTTASATITAPYFRVGGFVGRVQNGRITKSYASGHVTGILSSGGFVSIIEAGCTVDSCYFNGQVSGGANGFCYFNSGTINSCYWDIDASGVTVSNGGIGLTTCQMKTTGTFESDGWRFPAVWTQNSTNNNGYPALAWQGFTHSAVDTLDITGASQINTTCSSTSNGSATVTLTGGTGTRTYSWSPSGGSSSTASNLTAGSYTVTVTDANTCSVSQTFSIVNGDSIPPQLYYITCSSNSNASGTAYSDGWQNGDNDGSGFNAWTLNASTGNTSQAGFLRGSSITNGAGVDNNGDGDINSGGFALGLYANSAQATEAIRPFPTALAANSILQIEFDNGNVAPGQIVGFQLQNSSGNSLGEVRYRGGQATYEIVDANGITPFSSIPFTDEGIIISVKSISTGIVQITLTRKLDGVSQTLTSNLFPGGGNQLIRRFKVFNSNAGSGLSNTLFVNNFSICSVTNGCPSNVSAFSSSGTCNATVTFPSIAAVDNCDGNVSVIQTSGLPSGSSFSVGTTINTFTATDGNGNTSTCSFSVTVQDTVRPVAICQNTTIYIASNGIATVTPAQLDAGSTDACGIASYSLSQTTFNCSQIAADFPIVLTVTDVHGNVAACTSLVDIYENLAPVALCHDTTLYLNATGDVTLTAPMIDDGTYDECHIVDLRVYPWNSWSVVLGCANLGTNNVTLGSHDQFGNFGTCTSVVTILDTIDPLPLCQNLTVHLNASGNASIIPAMINNGSSDACGIASMSVSPNSFSCANVGSNTVTLTVTDVSGNSSTCTSIVTVVDTIRPVVNTQNLTLQLNAAGTASIIPAMVNNGSTDACGIASMSVSPNSFSCANIGANTVTLTVTDVNGNSRTGTAIVTVADTVHPVAICQNISVTLSGGTATITGAMINNGSYDNCSVASLSASPNTFTCSNTGANTVTLTVTDQSGNSSSCTAIVTVINPVTASASSPTFNCGTNVSCNGATNGSATVTPAGGVGPYTYLWSNLQTTVTATGLGAGTYTVTITDAGGCGAQTTVTLTEPAPMTSSASSPTFMGGYNVSCNGAADGSATITVTSGCPTYTYLWSNGQTSSTATGLTAGTLTYTVTSSNGCISSGNITLSQPSPLSASVASQNNVSCYGGNNGAASVNVIGGTAGYTYDWAPGNPTGDGTYSVTSLTVGTWTCTVTDVNACTATQTFSVTSPALLIATASSQSNTTCFGGSDGTATVSASGGAFGYNYSWAPSGGVLSTASGLSFGTYTVTVTDGYGCTATQTFSITQPTQVVASAAAQTNVQCNGASNGAATVGAAGGAGSYTYSWSPTGGTAATATGLAAGVYTVTVTDANSCTATQTFNITQPSALSASTMQTNVSCNAGSNGDAMVMVSGGTGSYTYSWAPSGGTNATATGLTAGTYTCTTTDANGCTLTSTVSITEPSALTAASSASTVLCNGDTSTVTVTASGGVSPYTGAGSFNQVAGSYTFTVTDNNGCTTTTSVTITEPTAISTVVASTNVLCNGDSTGSIDLTVTGGTAPYTFNWNSGQYTTEDLINIPAGSYSGVLTDANGCTDGGTVVINEPSVLAATAVITNPTGCTTNDGSIDLSVAGGTPGYAYVWSTTATTQDVTALDGGNYTVTVTDTNGCSAVESFTLTEPLPPTVTFSAGLDTVCQSTTTPFTLTGASPAGGVFSGTGMINDTVFDPMTASIGFNVITYTYTDSLGCTGSAVDSILVDVCTDLASQLSGLNSQFSIFPNPNNGAFTVITSTFADMMIYDAQGKLVAAQKVQASVQNQINIEGSGMYLITIVAADGSRTTQRVVVTK
ncbi:MAG: HYR domain-containing protein [Bacteroidia bacterium]|nr:HYR domain-containing protein [Bacteroidia bacterium]